MKVDCPNCAAPVEVKPGNVTVVCDRCKRRFWVESRVIQPAQIECRLSELRCDRIARGETQC